MRTRTYTTLIEKHIVAFRAASMRVSNIDDPIAFPDPCKEAEHSTLTFTGDGGGKTEITVTLVDPAITALTGSDFRQRSHCPREPP